MNPLMSIVEIIAIQLKNLSQSKDYKVETVISWSNFIFFDLKVETNCMN